MSKFVFTLSVLLASSAFAHIEQGTHAGLTADGQVCSMIAGAQTFENNMPHPLNERIALTVNGHAFVVRHPAVIDVSTSTASFNHDLFEGVLAVSGGAKALVVKMAHTADFEGPTEYTLIENNWKTGEKKSFTCTGLKFQD